MSGGSARSGGGGGGRDREVHIRDVPPMAAEYRGGGGGGGEMWSTAWGLFHLVALFRICVVMQLDFVPGWLMMDDRSLFMQGWAEVLGLGWCWSVVIVMASTRGDDVLVVVAASKWH